LLALILMLLSRWFLSFTVITRIKGWYMQIFEAFTVAVPNAAAPRGWLMIRPTLNIGLTHTPLLFHGPTVQMV
jgi:hypothetical protein